MTTCSLLGASPASGPTSDLVPALSVASVVPYHPPSRNPIQTHLASAVSGSAMTGAQTFEAELALIERVIAWVCARRSLRGADGEDFASTVKLRLIENDYEILNRFEGRSSLKTYLAAVISRLYIDYQNQRFGKWRPSAQARRLGPLALRLECLLYRDGLTFEEARGMLQTGGVTESPEALYALSRELPVRNTRRTGDGHEPSHGVGGLSEIEQAERRTLAEKTFAALRRALHRLPARDRIVLRMHVEGELSLADVARALGEEQKALYRRRDATYKTLRLDLETQGIGCDDARELLSTLDWDSALTAGVAGGGSLLEEAASRPSPVGRRDRQEGEP
jgi:RNA polymerase sigma factor (sigma-70 family)